MKALETQAYNVQVISSLMLTARLRNQASREGDKKKGGRDIKDKRGDKWMSDMKAKSVNRWEHYQ